MADTCEVVVLDGVKIQENGIIRNSKGYLIGRLVNKVGFNSEHVKPLAKEEKIEVRGFIDKLAFKFMSVWAKRDKRLVVYKDPKYNHWSKNEDMVPVNVTIAHTIRYDLRFLSF